MEEEGEYNKKKGGGGGKKEKKTSYHLKEIVVPYWKRRNFG